MSANDLLRQLPSVNELLAEANALVETEGHDRAVQALREALDEARDSIRSGATLPTNQYLIESARVKLSTFHFKLSTVINATGVILHTNLGRAPLSKAAQEAMLSAAKDYSPLEFDMETGERGKRGDVAEKLLCKLTGAEAALIVNNCAFATVLMLAAHAKDKGVVVSRSQLVEIGGGFRVPEVMSQSGARLIEVGTTNKVRRDDYENAIRANADVAAILRAHPSNFKIVGFTSEVSIEKLVEVARASSIVVLDDLGSGALIDTSEFGLSKEPMPQESVRAGVDVVCFSGDKLMGGPQAGIMIGKKSAIEVCRTHPFARAFRSDKFTLAALTATLLHYARGEAQREVPVVRMMAMTKDEINVRAERLKSTIGGWLSANDLQAELIDGESAVGGGSLPGETLPTKLIALHGETWTSDKLLNRLRERGVIARIQNERVMLDLRTVLEDAKLVNGLLR
jgi:L-seryl-tRNA(Ser) seleniumtransferase